MKQLWDIWQIEQMRLQQTLLNIELIQLKTEVVRLENGEPQATS
jgi:hypothetical protein